MTTTGTTTTEAARHRSAHAKHLVCALCVVGWLAVASSAQGQPGPAHVPPRVEDGTEIVVTDRGGFRYLGYGRVRDGAVALDVSGGQTIAVVVVHANGSVETIEARLGPRTIELYLDDATVSLADWLAERGVQLSLSVRGRAVAGEAGRSRDDGAGAPGDGADPPRDDDRSMPDEDDDDGPDDDDDDADDDADDDD